MKKLIDLIFPDITIDLSKDFNTCLDYAKNSKSVWFGAFTEVKLPKVRS